ncbi:Chloroperoxidase [Glomus cerebriforme]|uniref:Chloroperoxidase n=1 Tax=Glomus cerebriforme TaxID=658196 RepID=A0A397SK56_9GLOM|nr:Chloroperoxidase [Glomus cerebriforme]
MPHPEYKPPGENDVRSPCPALNCLANHGFLPRSGKDFSMSELIDALKKGFNLSGAFASMQALTAFTMYGKLFQKISLSDLQRHGVLEHDASLTRQDAAIGDHVKVDNALVDLLLTYKVNEKINIESLAKLHHVRYADSKERNKDFYYGWRQKSLSFGESSLLLCIIGAATNKEIDTKVAEILFKKEKLADEWKASETPIGFFEILNYQKEIEKKAEEVKPK